jgi:hypothetical protein
MADTDYNDGDNSNIETWEPRPTSKTEAAVAIGFIVAALAGVAALVRWDFKEQKKQEEVAREEEHKRQKERDEFNAWVDEQPSKGKVIIKPQVGTHIAIPIESYKDIEIKRLPGIRY